VIAVIQIVAVLVGKVAVFSASTERETEARGSV